MRTSGNLATALGLTLAVLPACCVSSRGPAVTLICSEDNDLFRVLKASGFNCIRFGDAAEALRNTPHGGGLLILSDDYPDRATALPPDTLEIVKSKGARLYAEFTAVPGVKQTGEARLTGYERAVVTSDFFGPGLAKMRIIAAHARSFLPVEADAPLISLAKVAGLDNALYGLPQESFPLLFIHPGGDAMIATTKLSDFATARFAPSEAWREAWTRVLAWLLRSKIPALNISPAVRPSFNATDELPDYVEELAFRRGAEWFLNSRLLIHKSWAAKVDELRAGYHDGVAPAPQKDWPVGDGSEGLLEGYSSTINSDGSQPARYYLRNDCIGESAMALAFAGALTKDRRYSEVSRNLLDFAYFKSAFAKGPRSDPASPTYGLLSWFSNPPADGVYYGDDNARGLLGHMAASALLGSEKYDALMLRCVMANLRTCGRNGFRAARLEEPQLQANGWRHFFQADTIHYAPHYQAYLWACYLHAYRQTGYELFLRRAKTAIRMTMEAYPDSWHWTNGIQQERARMLLPLAWLVRIEDTGEHRAWLRRIASDMLEDQDACGAIREELGLDGMGDYGPPKSNEAYGSNEATLIQSNGDPVCDLLYTTNFAFIGLHEASAATGEALYVDAEKKLARFLCRIQVRSETHPELDGAWFRAFDFGRWDYWASNADAGWGAWSIETGWTQGWITSVLAMRRQGTSLWELAGGSGMGGHFDELYPVMFPGGE
ncbi:MAG TPA: hypothetical protein PL033_11895 [Candidatus Brocadiia bacterium]|nr:hypothetical protein [Candidatus Brocadiia bacterium]